MAFHRVARSFSVDLYMWNLLVVDLLVAAVVVLLAAATRTMRKARRGNTWTWLHQKPQGHLGNRSVGSRSPTLPTLRERRVASCKRVKKKQNEESC